MPEKYFSLSRGTQSGAFRILRCGIVPRRTGTERDFVTSEYAMVCVVSGRGEYLDDQGRSWNFEPGCIIQRFPDKSHSICWHEPGSTAFIAAPRPIFELLKLLCGNDFTCSPIIKGYAPSRFCEECRIIHRMLESINKNQLIEAANHIQMVFSEILTSQTTAPRQNPYLLARVDKFINSHDWNRISVTTLAKACNMNINSFREKFRRETGLPPGRYIIIRRIDTAAKLLLQEELSIGEIADLLGYSDIYTFSKQFRKFRGISPSAYRHSPDA